MQTTHTIIARTHIALALSLGLGAAGTSLADDLAPPPWDRLGAANYTTAAEWEFFASGPMTYVADGVEVPYIGGDGGGGFPSDLLTAGDISWSSYDGDGAWTANPGGADDAMLNFRVSNWVDTEPLKIIRVQMVYDRGGTSSAPYVFDIIPFDPLGTDSITPISVTDTPIPLDALDRIHRLEVWEIEPNPDFESIQIVVPDGVSVDQIVIDTISTVPEPSALAIIGLGGLLATRRRRA